MARQTTQAKKREEEEDDRNDEEEDDEDTRDDEEEDEDEGSKFKGASDSDGEEDDDEEGDDLDSALADRGGKPSIFIEPWRKKGNVTVWLHPKTKFARVGRHKWFRIVQYTKRNGEEVSYIRFEMFNSHEPADFVSFSKERGDDLKRIHRARICPMSKMIEWVDDAVIDGRISPDQVVFRFDDNDPEHLVELHAAGLTGLIGLENAPEKWKKICKRSKVLQKDPWNENMNLKLSHVFQVVQDNDPSEVKWAVEPPDLFFQLKDAIAKEKKRNGDDDGDPMKHPYALLWEFDEAQARKNYGKGNSVIPQPKRRMTNKIRRLLEGPKRNDQQDVIGPGNLLELRASMEHAAQIDMPFDEFFREAKKAGLMSGSAKSQSAKTTPKRDDDEESEPKSDPKPKAASKAAAESAKGKSAKVEPEVVGTCDICGEGIGDDDIECGACGTTFDSDDEYHVDGIKCIDCGIVVPLKDASEEDGDLKQICPKCGAVHRLSPSVERFYGELRDKAYKGEVKFVWTMESKSEPKKEAAPKREGRSGRGKASSDSDKLDKKLGKDQIPF
jgi:hypothetical protein